MAKNKQSIQQVDTRMEFLFKRLTRTVSELNELRVKRKKMVSGKIKVPPPPGIKVKIESNPNGLTADEFGDVLPTFGSGAVGIE